MLQIYLNPYYYTPLPNPNLFFVMLTCITLVTLLQLLFSIPWCEYTTVTILLLLLVDIEVFCNLSQLQRELPCMIYCFPWTLVHTVLKQELGGEMALKFTM